MIPRLEISPGKGNSYPLQYSGLKNSMGPQRVGLDRVTFTSLHFATPWTAECQAPLSFTISWSLLKFMSVECYLTISSSAPFSPFAFSLSHHQGFFSNESALHMRWPKNLSFSLSISPCKKYSGLISLGLTGLISLLPKGLLTLQHHRN